MKKLLLALSTLILAISPALAAPEVGKPAPDFSATDIAGKPFKLSDHKGKIVVLEWTNHECPFVMKHYETGNMQKTQKAATDKGAEWISIVSSAPGKQGNVTKEEAAKIVTDTGAAPTAKILDESGAIGHLYDAKTTPHMFVIDKDGNVAYMGAIDDQPSPKHDTVNGAKNYVLSAIDALQAGTPVETASTQPYGCGVKYGE
ncbi:MAG: redoxin domain-containing protein [Alphaproteobacteria bacterium]|nr:redoxin domain-containing protein [Alphaproteobacteria bacterium]